MQIVLPWPPSVNGYWRSYRGRQILSQKARAYRKSAMRHVLACKANKHLTGRLAVDIELYPPNRMKIDIDNRIKALLDVMEHAGVYQDDSQIDKLTVERCEIEKHGAAVVKIKTIKEKRDGKANEKKNIPTQPLLP